MSDLIIENIYAGYNHTRILHGVNLELSEKPVAVMGRNGMGKTTLAQVIMGLLPIANGSISYRGILLNGLTPTEIARTGIAYVPQGRRVFPSLTVDEHFRILEKRNGEWSREKIYKLFPRLAERKKNGGAMLSGGEQQMLAIGRALMTNPTLLLMDEPSEGLAPVIVEHLGDTLKELVAHHGQRILLIEQNLGFASSLCDEVAILSNGQIQTIITSLELRNSSELQSQYLGVA